MKLKGIPAAVGPTVTGKARVIHSHKDLFAVKTGEIIVTSGGDLDINIVFSKIAGVVSDRGGILQHAAILAREFNLPCIVAVPDAVKVISTGQVVLLDAQKGEVEVF